MVEKRLYYNKLNPSTNETDARVRILYMYIVKNPLNQYGKGLWQVWLRIKKKTYLVDIDYESSSGNDVNGFKIKGNHNIGNTLMISTRSYTWSNRRRLFFRLIDDKYYFTTKNNAKQFEVVEI
jgi:hypothetical protein